MHRVFIVVHRPVFRGIMCLAEYIQLFLHILISGTLACEPAEIGKPYVISATWNLTSEMDIQVGVTWRKDNKLVASCASFSDCTDYYPQLTSMSYSRVSEYTLTSSITLLNVSHKLSGLWRLTYLGIESIGSSPLKTCNLQVFRRCDEVQCHKVLYKDGLNITCSTNLVYPKMSCEFYTTFSGYNSPDHALTYDHWESITTQRDVYYASRCTLHVNITSLTIDRHYFNVTMFPNISGTAGDALYGKSISLHINIGKPNLTLKGCPLVVEENSRVACICTATDPDLSGASYGWTNGGHMVEFIGNISQPFTDYCDTVFKSFLRTYPVFYRPIVKPKVIDIKCMSEFTLRDLFIQCSIPTFYKTSRCFISVARNRTDTMYENFKDCKNIVDRVRVNRTQCVEELSKTYLIPGMYDVFVNIFPAIEEGDGLYYGVNTTFQVNYTEEKVMSSNHLDNTVVTSLHYIYSVLLFVLFIVIVVLAVGFYRRSKISRLDIRTQRDINTLVAGLKDDDVDRSTEEQQPVYESIMDEPVGGYSHVGEDGVATTSESYANQASVSVYTEIIPDD